MWFVRVSGASSGRSHLNIPGSYSMYMTSYIMIQTRRSMRCCDEIESDLMQFILVKIIMVRIDVIPATSMMIDDQLILIYPQERTAKLSMVEPSLRLQSSSVDAGGCGRERELRESQSE